MPSATPHMHSLQWQAVVEVCPLIDAWCGKQRLRIHRASLRHFNGFSDPQRRSCLCLSLTNLDEVIPQSTTAGSLNPSAGIASSLTLLTASEGLSAVNRDQDLPGCIIPIHYQHDIRGGGSMWG